MQTSNIETLDIKTSDIENQNKKNNIYPIDIFLKYKNINKDPPKSFEKYFADTVNKNKKSLGCDILEKQDLRIKLNYIITKKIGGLVNIG